MIGSFIVIFIVVFHRWNTSCSVFFFWFYRDVIDLRMMTVWGIMTWYLLIVKRGPTTVLTFISRSYKNFCFCSVICVSCQSVASKLSPVLVCLVTISSFIIIIICLVVVIFHWQSFSQTVICSSDQSMASKWSPVQAGSYEFWGSCPLHFGESTQLGVRPVLAF